MGHHRPMHGGDVDSSDDIELLPAELFPSSPPPPIAGGPLLVGGCYELGRELGRGARGVVHEAVSMRTGRRVMLQRFHRPPSREEIGRFLHAARVGARLVHPHVVDVLDLGSDESGAPYAALEWLEGESLSADLARRGTLPLGEALRLLEPLADALALAHDEGLVHGNVSPRVIRWVPFGAARFPKLMGFGLARTMQQALDAVATEGLDAFVHRAPEQWIEGAVDGRADVWALAMVLFRSLTGRLPFEGTEPRAWMDAVVHTPCSAASEHALGLGAPVDRVIRRALAVDPEERTPSMRSFLAELVSLREEARPTTRPSAPLDEAEPDDTQQMRVSPFAGVRLSPTTPLRLGLVWTAPEVDLAEVARAMRDILGRPIELIRHTTYSGLVDAVLDHDVDLGWLPPVAYIRARRARNVRLLFTTLRGTDVPSYHAALLGRVGVVDRIEDARGKRAAWVDGWSAAGYLMPRMLLERAGLSSDEDLGAQGFVGSHDAVIAALKSGAADLGGTYCRLDAEGRPLGPFSSEAGIRVVAVSDPIPGDTLCAGPAVAPAEAEAMSLLLLEGAPRIAPLIAARGLASGDASHYDALERALLG